MRRRDAILGSLVITTCVAVAASCALNAGGIVYVTVESGAPDDGSLVTTLPDGQTVLADGAIVLADGGTPTGKCATDQVDLDAGFCIDKTEVTNAAYVAFLGATGGDAGNDFAPCAGGSLAPGNGYELVTAPTHPVRNVTWCQARAYCEWAGKRLCGTIADGGEVSEPTGGGDYKDAAASEWYFACSQNGALAYPYGNTYDGGACNTSDFHEGGVIPVGSDPGCVGGYPGIVDMSGNTWEWENSCADDTSNGAQCRLRGGSFNTNGSGNSRCDQDFTYGRTSSGGDFGVRCCSDQK